MPAQGGISDFRQALDIFRMVQLKVTLVPHLRDPV